MDKEYPKTLSELESQFWLGNEKPSLIWGEIGDILKRKGFTWPSYLRLLRMMKREVVLYEMGEKSHSILLGEVSNAASGPLGKYILETGG